MSSPADGEVVTHDSAMQSARKFIDYFFGNEGPKPRASIPADLSHDDDLILTRYIAQQCAKEAQQPSDTEMLDWCQKHLAAMCRLPGNNEFMLTREDADGISHASSGDSLRDAVRKAMDTQSRDTTKGGE